jgi:hypothetical protein
MRRLRHSPASQPIKWSTFNSYESFENPFTYENSSVTIRFNDGQAKQTSKEETQCASGWAHGGVAMSWQD